MHPTKCSQSSCPVNKGGLCLEGFDFDTEECPHALFSEEDEDGEEEVGEGIEDDSDVVIEKAEEGNNLFSGDAIDDSEIHTVTFAHLTKLILIMGEPASGKTTLLASVFNMFQKGGYAGFLFAGSKTQVGFEKRCHLARMASGRVTPEIERTSSDEFSYLHLAVRNADLLQPVRHLLFTDVSGERFRLVRDYDDELERLTILKQSSEIFYVVNGEDLADLAKRHATKSNVVRMLNRIQQNSSSSYTVNNICIIVSKWDKVVEADAEDKVEQFFIKPILNKFPRFVKQIEKVATRSDIVGLDIFLQICARPAIKNEVAEYISSAFPEREFYRLQMSGL